VKHPLRWILGGLAIVIVAVAGFGIWYVFADDAPPAPTLNATPGTTTAGGPDTPDGLWRVAPGDDVYVGYRIKETFAGDTVKKDAVGRTPAVTGSLVVGDNEVESASVTADLRELESNRATRDNYVKNNGLESARFPEAKFVLSKPIPLGSVIKGETVKADAAGTLTVHGVSNPVTIPVEARWNGTTIEVVGTTPIVLADYGISAPSTSVVSVEDNGSMELKLTFVQ
jgi:polyisoprenoid-binding protein YceI